MLKKNLPEFAAILTGTGEIFDKVFSSAAVDRYWKALQAFSLTEVEQAFDQHLINPDTGKFFPLPADIIATIKGNSRERALWAWAKASDAMLEVGAYNSIAFDDALIHVVIEEMSSWQKICATKTDHMPFVGKEFQERYRSYVLHKPPHHRSYLTGIIESQNSLYNYRYPSPVLFRNPALARKVIASGTKTPLLEHGLWSSANTHFGSMVPEEKRT